MAHAYEGIKNVLRHYGMLSGDIQRVDPSRGTPPRMVQAPNLTDYRTTPGSGIWEPVVRPGADVEHGELIGRIHDFSDHTSSPLEIRSTRPAW